MHELSIDMNHETFVEQAWHRADAVLKAIKEEGAEAYFTQLPERNRAFSENERTCACIDERVGGEKFALPGSGILLGREKAAAIIRANGLAKISSHKHCGAARLAYQTEHPDETPDQATVDAFADEWTRGLASELGIQYEGQVGVEGGDQHVARVVYYDGTGRFTPSALPELPQGFLVSRFADTPDETASGLSLAATIVFGSHGFGDRFTADEPLVMIPVAEQSMLPVLHQEIERAIAQTPFADRIRIDAGITAPEAAKAVAA